MSAPNDNKVVVRVEVEVGGVVLAKPPKFTQLQMTTNPMPWPSDTPILKTENSLRFIAANGNKQMNGKAAVIVRAKAYPTVIADPAAAEYAEPPADSPHDVPSGNGTWSFTTAKNNLIPHANCDALSGQMSQGANNSTLIVWYAFLGLSHWDVEATNFHGSCPNAPGTGGSGTSGSGLIAPPPAPAVLYAHFSGSLGALGSVPLVRSGGYWTGLSSGGVQLAFNVTSAGCVLTSPGPVVAFTVTGAPTSLAPFAWQVGGQAAYSGGGPSGPFTVIVTE